MCGIDTIQHVLRNDGSGCYVRNGLEQQEWKQVDLVGGRC